jgi:hypothetical protein
MKIPGKTMMLKRISFFVTVVRRGVLAFKLRPNHRRVADLDPLVEIASNGARYEGR